MQNNQNLKVVVYMMTSHQTAKTYYPAVSYTFR